MFPAEGIAYYADLKTSLLWHHLHEHRARQAKEPAKARAYREQGVLALLRVPRVHVSRAAAAHWGKTIAHKYGPDTAADAAGRLAKALALLEQWDQSPQGVASLPAGLGERIVAALDAVLAGKGEAYERAHPVAMWWKARVLLWRGDKVPSEAILRRLAARWPKFSAKRSAATRAATTRPAAPPTTRAADPP
jgi:hypothetical protein